MKKILLFFLMLVSVAAISQPANYLNIRSRYNLIAVKTDSGFHVPCYSTIPNYRGGVWSGAGNIGVDTVNHKFYFYSGGSWREAGSTNYADSLRRTGLAVQMQKGGVWTTQFNLPDSSGGSSDSSWAKITVGNKTQIGTRYEYNWATNPLGADVADNTTTATVTTDGSKTNVSGGALNNSNSMSLETGCNYITTHNWLITQTIVPHSKSSTTYGMGVYLRAGATGQSLMAQFLLSDTTGYLQLGYDNSVPNNSQLSNKNDLVFKWSANDTLDLSIQRQSRWLYIKMRNRANGMVSQLFYPFVHTSVVTPQLYFWGSDIDLIGSFKIQYQDVYRPKIGIIGTSITYNGTSFNEATSWVNIGTEGIKDGVLNMAASTERSLDGVYKLYDIVNYVKPEILLVDYAVNDKAGGVSADSFSARLQRIVIPAQDSGITVLMCTGTPLTSFSMVAFNDTVKAIAARRGITVIDNYEALNNPAGTDMYGIYYTDGVHFNQLANNVLGGKLRSYLSPLVSYESTAVIPVPPTNNKPLYLASFDANYNLTRTLSGTDTSYARVLPDGAVSTNTQPGGINLFGNHALLGYDTRIGGTYSSPYIHVDGYGLTTITSLLSQGLYVDGTMVQIGSTTRPIVMVWDFQSYERPHRLTFRYPATSVNAVIWNTTNENGDLANTYKFLSVQNDSTEKAYIDRSGGLHSDTVHQYNSDLSALIDANDRNIPDVGWVNNAIAEAIVGGDGGIYTKQQDTITLATFSAGARMAADTAAFTDSTLYGSFYNDGSDTLIITKLIAVMNGGTSDTLGVQVYFNDTVNVIGSTVATSTLACNSTTTGNATTSLTNYKIPPGNWVWCKTPVVVAGRKPYYLSVSLIGYKKRK